jgi:hypothetical protein
VGNSINWSSYNKSLISRGKITFWFDKSVINSWYAVPNGRPGAQSTYSDTAIETLSILRFKFGLKLRCTQGFAESLIELMGLPLEIPNYTTLCRRLGKISLKLQKIIKSGKPIHVVIDSTGLKVYGEGEWKVRQHGYSKRRTWRKLHLGVDESNSQIVAMVLTDNSFKDNEVYEDLIDDVDDEIEQVSADGAYDSKNCYEKSVKDGINLVTPPRRGAILKKHGNRSGPPDPRDLHIREIRDVGRKQWKKNNRYHRRSISETAMYRFKTLLGEKLLSREFDRQANEVFIKCQILNKMSVPSSLPI